MLAVYIAIGVAGFALAGIALLRTSKNERDIKALKARMEAKGET